MYSLILENESGARLTFGMGGAYTISEIDGLSAPEATINTFDMALADGQQYSNAKVSTRTLQIAFAIEYDAEQKRLDAYNVLRIKKPITMYYKSDLIDVFIEGYVSKCNVSHFDMKQIMTVTILCPSPYFKSAQQVINELSSIVKAFTFPFAITEPAPIPFSYVQKVTNVTVANQGTVDTGLTIVLYASGDVANPKVFDYETGDYFGLNITMYAGDEVTITTGTGVKAVTLLRGGVTSNLFNDIAEGSTWLQLHGAESVFVYQADSGAESLTVEFRHYDMYAGV